MTLATWKWPWSRADKPPKPPDPLEDDEGVSTVTMTLSEHLLELRTRLIISSAALLVSTVVAFAFYSTLWRIITGPCLNERFKCELITIEPTEQVFTAFKVALFGGIILAIPVIAYEIWAFVAPGLTRRERRYVVWLVPGATVSFLAGILFAYYVILPTALNFLLGVFTLPGVTPQSTISKYVSFVTRLTIAIGVVFEMPLFMFFFAKIRLIDARKLSRARRYVVVGIVLAAAVITPTPDPINQFLVAIPMFVLYEIGVLLTRIANPGT